MLEKLYKMVEFVKYNKHYDVIYYGIVDDIKIMNCNLSLECKDHKYYINDNGTYKEISECKILESNDSIIELRCKTSCLFEENDFDSYFIKIVYEKSISFNEYDSILDFDKF